MRELRPLSTTEPRGQQCRLEQLGERQQHDVKHLLDFTKPPHARSARPRWVAWRVEVPNWHRPNWT